MGHRRCIRLFCRLGCWLYRRLRFVIFRCTVRISLIVTCRITFLIGADLFFTVCGNISGSYISANIFIHRRSICLGSRHNNPQNKGKCNKYGHNRHNCLCVSVSSFQNLIPLLYKYNIICYNIFVSLYTYTFIVLLLPLFCKCIFYHNHAYEKSEKTEIKK